MPFCGFNTKMVEGLAIFARGLFEATLDRSHREGISIDQAFEREVAEMGLLLEALETSYQKLRGQLSSPEAMHKLVETIELPRSRMAKED